MVACYPADSLGTWLLSLWFLVVEAAELAALGRTSPSISVFPQVFRAPLSAFTEEGGALRAGEDEQSLEI